jgi:hypothetical protein
MICQFVMIIIALTSRGDYEVKNTVSGFVNGFVFISEQLVQKFCLDKFNFDDTLVITGT